MKIKFLILLAMIYMHIIDDFTLQQSWLANGKQITWWKRIVPTADFDKYKNDYKVALLTHSTSWAISIMASPILFTLNKSNLVLIISCLIFNIFLHYLIDDLKANKKVFNLVTDQIFHLIQIFVTWLSLCIL